MHHRLELGECLGQRADELLDNVQQVQQHIVAHDRLTLGVRDGFGVSVNITSVSEIRVVVLSDRAVTITEFRNDIHINTQ